MSNFRLFACGDIVNNQDTHDFIDNTLLDTMRSCDGIIGNLEAPIIKKSFSKIDKAGSWLSQPRSIISYLQSVGFSYLSLATNHIYDYGDDGLVYTLDQLSSSTIAFNGAGIGIEATYEPTQLTIQNTKIGIVAGCEAEFGCFLPHYSQYSGYAWLYSGRIDSQVRKIKKSVDIVVVMAHGGIEEIDVPLPEVRDRYYELCDAGADIVIGSHPHVPQGYEFYSNSFICYSLGNFYFNSGSGSETSGDNYSLILNFENKKLVSVDPYLPSCCI